MSLAQSLALRRPLRAIGVDDGPFVRGAGQPVPLCAVLCRGASLRSLAMGAVVADGDDATAALIALLGRRSLKGQAEVLLTDGLTVGGLNCLDLGAIFAATGLPCIAHLRRPPDLEAFFALVDRLPGAAARRVVLAQAGPLEEHGEQRFHAVGLPAAQARAVLAALTVEGKVPEPLRLAHRIAGAMVLGEPGARA